MKRISARRRWAAPALAAAVLLTTACGDDSTSAGDTATSEDKGSLTIAFSNAVPQVEKVPTILAAEQLEEEGYEVELVWLQSSEDPVQAVVRGDAQIGTANTSTIFGATAQGAPVKAIAAQNKPAYAMVVPVGVTSPEGLDGLKVGIHAQVSSTALYTNLLLKDHPEVKPNTLVVPGSANRIQALIAGELDASVVQLSDLQVLEEKAPGKFHVLLDYAAEMGDIIDSAIFTSDSFLDENPEAVQDFLDALLTQQQRIKDDPQVLVDGIVANVPDVTEEQAKGFADTYLSSNVWPEDGNFTDDSIATTLDAIKQYGGLDGEPTADLCCTSEPLNEVLGQ
ncbi:ABC transporter substrate-binding protein [Jiangella muralis]|uniref:ABC transporter substrate-binding protein n=1 Tax=Jiangella muralis TaxID=702383 RepID=UPI00069E2829|nr:ABC transporter substrate-binding protein [Jiangella muralis]